jgi:hypothetical protein
VTYHLFGGKRDQRVVLTFSTALIAALDAHRERKSEAAVVRLAIASLIRNAAEKMPDQATQLASPRCDLHRFELVMAGVQSTALRECATCNGLTMCEVAELACWRYLAV